MDLKEEFVLRAKKEKQSFSSLCQEYGISRKTGYKWLERFTEDGFGGLENQSRKPQSSPEKLDEEIICKLIRLKKDHLKWGPKKIHALYLRHSSNKVSLSSVKRVLKKSGFVKERRRRRQNPVERINQNYEVNGPNDLWTVDFKGWWYAKDREKCEPLTIRDEYSRFLLEVRILPSTRTEHVKEAFKRIFKIYGLPKVIRSDNGSPFASGRGLRGLTGLSVWWISLGINLHRIEPGKPSQNGSHERMHKDIKDQIQKEVKGNSTEIQKSLDIWRQEFNTVRPHEALDMKTPADVYRKSVVSFTDCESDIEYPIFYRTRKVSRNGYIQLDKTLIYLSSALKGFTVGITDLDSTHFAVYFDYIELGLIDRETYAFKPFYQKQLPTWKNGLCKFFCVTAFLTHQKTDLHIPVKTCSSPEPSLSAA
jgi:transposase InsO family protein